MGVSLIMNMERKMYDFLFQRQTNIAAGAVGAGVVAAGLGAAYLAQRYFLNPV